MKSLQEPEAVLKRWLKNAPRPIFWAVTVWLWATVIYSVSHFGAGLQVPIAAIDSSLLLTAGLMMMFINWMVVVKLWNWVQRRVSKEDRTD